jgi:hypothetical protein
MRRLLVIAALASAALTGCETAPDPVDVDYYETAAVGLYCHYGAVSGAQAEGCRKHVSFDELADRYVHGNEDGDSLAAVHAIECLAMWTPTGHRVFASLIDRYVDEAVSHAVPGAEGRVRRLIDKRRELLEEQLEIGPTKYVLASCSTCGSASIRRTSSARPSRRTQRGRADDAHLLGDAGRR